MINLRPVLNCFQRWIFRFFEEKFPWLLRPAPGELVEAEGEFLAKKIKYSVWNE